jgi:hypothetical protein
MTASHRPADLAAFMPVVFVLIWSTGFVVARFGMPFAPPMRFPGANELWEPWDLNVPAQLLRSLRINSTRRPYA